MYLTFYWLVGWTIALPTMCKSTSTSTGSSTSWVGPVQQLPKWRMCQYPSPTPCTQMSIASGPFILLLSPTMIFLLLYCSRPLPMSEINISLLPTRLIQVPYTGQVTLLKCKSCHCPAQNSSLASLCPEERIKLFVWLSRAPHVLLCPLELHHI